MAREERFRIQPNDSSEVRRLKRELQLTYEELYAVTTQLEDAEAAISSLESRVDALEAA